MRATKVTVTIEAEDGTHEMQFLHRGEFFDVGVEADAGSPKAESGEVRIILPHWPALRSFVPRKAGPA